MPRDNDKDNASRGRRDGPVGAKGRAGKPRGLEKKFVKRGFAPKKFEGAGDKPRFGRDDRPRGDRLFRDRPARDGDGEKRAFKPRGDRPKFDRDGGNRPFKPREDRGGEKRPYSPRGNRGEGGPASRFSHRKFGAKKPFAARVRERDTLPPAPRGKVLRRGGAPPRAPPMYGPPPSRDGGSPERKLGGE